jgi:putative exosortase-associated protein (TIGR04073 family)
MKKLFLATAISILTLLTAPAFASDMPKPESIAEKMSFKLVRGVTNVATSIVELPKQTILTARNHGTVGYVVGPIKGVGMSLYRCFIGMTETIFFMVPQPGYYDPMMDPEFVWQGWESPRADVLSSTGEQSTREQPTEQKSGEK